MRAILSLFVSVACIAVAGPLDLGTFSVSGGGGFGCDFQDASSGFHFSFAGRNTSYMIDASSPGLGGGFTGGNLQFPCFATVGQSVTLADTFPPSFDVNQRISAGFMPLGTGNWTISDAATFRLGDGTGYLDIYDNASGVPGNPANLIATAALSGYVSITSITGTQPPHAAPFGTFQILPDPPDTAPEPGSVLLVLAGAVALGCYFAFARGWSLGVFCSSANSKPLR